MRFRRSAALAAVLALSVAAAGNAATYTVDANHSAVVFQIRHFLSQVYGRFDKFSGTIVRDDENPANSSVEFVIQAASVNTNQERRDNDLRGSDFFDVANHPEIRFVSTKVEKVDDSSYRVTGNLSMRGVTKEIVLPVEFAGEMADGRGGMRAGFVTSTTLDRKAWGIVWNRVLDAGGTMLGDDVKIEISLEAAKS